MSVRPILRWPDPRLSKVCDLVGEVTPEIEALAADMLETMYAAPGRGLAAPQVGVMQRLFVMDAAWKTGAPAPMVFLNPEIHEASSEMATHEEGCLSIPGVAAQVTRPARVRVGWIGLDGVRQDRWFDGFEAACVQHEADHLDGKVTFDHLSPADREALEATYGALA